jgi:YVTN family beta-propeller protein
VWVANEGDATVSVLDPESGATKATLTGVPGAHNVQSADGGSVYVTAAAGVVAVDAHEYFVQAHAAAGDHPAHVVAAPDGSVFVTSSGDGVVHRYAEGLEPDGGHLVGGAPQGMRISADGTLAAVANTGAGTVDLISLDSRREVRAVPVGPDPVQVAVTDDAGTVFVSVAGSAEVVRVDVASGRVTGRTAVPAPPAQIWLTGDGRVLSANQGTPVDPGSTLSVIDTESMEIAGTVRTGAGPHGIAVDPSERRVWVTNAYDDSVTIIDLPALEPLATVPVGDAPNGITFTSVIGHHPQPRLELALPDRAGGHGHGRSTDAGHGHWPGSRERSARVGREANLLAAPAAGACNGG